MSHTPGPWKATQDVDTRGRDTWRIGSRTVGLMAVLTIGDKELAGEVGENARLIAAAPDLLEACEIARDCGAPSKVSLYDEEGVEGWRWVHPDGREWEEVGDHGSEPPTHPEILAAIAKAKGE